MQQLAMQLWTDDAGFIVSAELILIATITVLSLVVGLTEISHSINNELEDVGSAFGAVNQSYRYQGNTGAKGMNAGSYFGDHKDECDSEFDISCNTPPSPEGSYNHGW